MILLKLPLFSFYVEPLKKRKAVVMYDIIAIFKTRLYEISGARLKAENC